MKCPECGAWSIVLETRNGIRKRECAGAFGDVHVFHTREVIERPKADARREKMEERDAVIIEAMKRPGATVSSVARELEIPRVSVQRSISRAAAKKGPK